jgi:hypothetical protein
VIRHDQQYVIKLAQRGSFHYPLVGKLRGGVGALFTQAVDPAVSDFLR